MNLSVICGMVMHSMVIVFTGSKKNNDDNNNNGKNQKEKKKTVLISSFYEFVICDCLAGSPPLPHNVQ